MTLVLAKFKLYIYI